MYKVYHQSKDGATRGEQDAADFTEACKLAVAMHQQTGQRIFLEGEVPADHTEDVVQIAHV